MSQSPTGLLQNLSKEDQSLQRYQDGWRNLNHLLRNGGSLSGREQNCCFLNLGNLSPAFADISHTSGFDSSGDGRALVTTDWDGDGDLDLWISNRTAPRLQYFRNDINPARRFITVRLHGTTSNRDAVGARVEVQVEPSLGIVSRTVTAGDAYLSQSSKLLHFGLGNATRIASVRVRWPGSHEFQRVEGIELDGHYDMFEHDRVALRRDDVAMRSRHTAEKTTSLPPRHNKMVVAGRLPLPPIEIQWRDHNQKVPDFRQPTLLLLWSPDCPNCLKELAHWTSEEQRVRSAKLEVIAISAAEGSSTPSAQLATDELRFPFARGLAPPGTLEMVEAYLAFLQPDYQRPLAVPMSFLLDQYGQVAVVYRETVSVNDVLSDMTLLAQSPAKVRQQGLPFVGEWLRAQVRPSPIGFASQLSDQFGPSAATRYFEHVLAIAARDVAGNHDEATLPADATYAISDAWRSQAYSSLGTIMLSEGRFRECAEYCAQAQQLSPDDFRNFANHGAAMLKLGRPAEALALLNRAMELSPNRPSVIINRAAVHSQLGNQSAAIDDYESLLAINPDDERSRMAAAALAFATGDDQRAAVHYEELLRRDERSVDAAGALAWILATSNDDSLRNGQRALTLATTWSEHRHGRDYKALNALAAALAESGDFFQAVSTIDRAIELADQQGDARTVTAYRTRRALYQSNQPFRRKSE